MTVTTVIEIIYLLLMAGKKDAVEHIRRHEKLYHQISNRDRHTKKEENKEENRY